MPISTANMIQTGNPALYAGPIIFRQGRVDTPLLSMIGNKRRVVDNEIFVLGQYYVAPVAGDSVIPEISDVPDSSVYKRQQDTNLTELHAKSIAVTDYSRGNYGELGGPHLKGQHGTPLSELDWQRAMKAQEMALDIEYALINSKYEFRNGDNTKPNRTRGLNEAIKTNVLDIKGEMLSWNHLNDLLCMMADNGASTVGLVLGCDRNTMTQLSVEAKSEHFEVSTGVTSINGINVVDIQTVNGFVRCVELRYLPEGTAFVLNLDALSLVEQPFYNGGFMWVPQGRQGNKEVEMMQGAIGLDYGAEMAHGKITGISTNKAVFQGTKVFVSNAVVPTTEVEPVLSGATLAGAQVGIETAALELEYVGDPTADPTLTYQWQIAKSAIGSWADIEGATSATYTPVADDEGMYLRCVVTADGTANGTVNSNCKKVAAAAE